MWSMRGRRPGQPKGSPYALPRAGDPWRSHSIMVQDIQMIDSQPSPKMKILLALSFAITLGICVADHNALTIYIFLAFAIFNCVFLIPRLLWGFGIQGDQITVTFPLWPRMNRTFTLNDVIQAEVVKNPIRVASYSDFLRLRFKSGKEIKLALMGTTHPQLLVKHLIEKPDEI